MLTFQLTPEEGAALRLAAEKALRDGRLELPDFEEIDASAGKSRQECERARFRRERVIAGLLQRLGR
jgi:hypothetical protein